MRRNRRRLIDRLRDIVPHIMGKEKEDTTASDLDWKLSGESVNVASYANGRSPGLAAWRYAGAGGSKKGSTSRLTDGLLDEWGSFRSLSTQLDAARPTSFGMPCQH